MAMIRNGKIYRNVPEQVEKNKEDIEALQQNNVINNLKDGEGNLSIAQTVSHAEGYLSAGFAGGIARDSRAVAFGAGIAEAPLAFAAGEFSDARNWAGAAFGHNTKTGRSAQLVCGINNVGKNNTFFEVGFVQSNYVEVSPKPSYAEACAGRYYQALEGGGHQIITAERVSEEEYNSYPAVYEDAPVGPIYNAFEVTDTGKAHVYNSDLNDDTVINGFIVKDNFVGKSGNQSINGALTIEGTNKIYLGAYNTGYSIQKTANDKLELSGQIIDFNCQKLDLGNVPLTNGTGANYGVTVPNTVSWSNNKTVATTDDIHHLYVHHFDVIVTTADLPLLGGATAAINVNAISNDPNQWATLSELDGGGYIISAFGNIVLPAISTNYVFELKLFYSALNTLLINIHDLTDNTVKCVALQTVGNGQSPNSYAIADSVSEI